MLLFVKFCNKNDFLRGKKAILVVNIDVFASILFQTFSPFEFFKHYIPQV